MHALPILLATLSAAALAPALLRALDRGGHTRPNYRGRRLPFPFGVLISAAALLVLIPLALIARLASAAVFGPELEPILIYCLGVVALGLIDDTLGERGSGSPDHSPAASGAPVAPDAAASGASVAPDAQTAGPPGSRPGPSTAGAGEATRPFGNRRASGAAEAMPPPRGWRGHGAAILRGEFSTGAVKAAGSLGLALIATDQLGRSDGRWLLATGVLVLATNAFNLLDLRPGRAIKVFVLLGAGLTIGSGPRALWALGLLAGPALVAGVYDLRERAMLGDTGSNLLGAMAGLWLVLTLSGIGQLIALVALAAITVYGELRSISELIERTPGMRQLDSWGRPS